MGDGKNDLGSHWRREKVRWVAHAYANSRHETVYPSASAERGHPPPADRAAERGSAPQPDPHRCPRWLWENHAGQRMGGWLRPAGGLAVAGRRGERPDTLSDVPGRCFTDDCAYHWGRGVGCAPSKPA